jgi:hypothetical protein
VNVKKNAGVVGKTNRSRSWHPWILTPFWWQWNHAGKKSECSRQPSVAFDPVAFLHHVRDAAGFKFGPEIWYRFLVVFSVSVGPS